ncbi:gliding motility-associated C-terminal domain-containing protein [Phaeodactylibacter xiamenensis]|uniref:T9SS type B sorting domain-containing protein n=1 Tax=Phaeodactylibacter xiamenensis TaxID=1524460 RepID=UPI003CCBC860
MKRNLLLCLLTLTTISLWAQQPPGPCPPGEPALANNCGAACVLCDFTTFTSSNDNPNTGQQVPPDFCPGQPIQPHNVQWVGFVAGTPNISMNVLVENCNDGNGLQIGVWGTSDCSSFNLVSQCSYQVNPNTPTPFNMTGLTVGATYFFIVDGFDDDVCDFTVNVTSGSTTVPPVSGVPNIIPTTPPPYCPGSTVTLSVNGVQNAGAYQWTVNGTPVNQGNQETVTINLPDEANYTICVTPSNACNGAGIPNCTTISTTPPPTEMITEVICQDEAPYTYQGSPPFFETGVYNFSYFQNGCQQPVQLDLTVIPPIPPTLITAEICEDETYIFQGTPLNQTGQYEETLTTADGCDSTVILNLTVNPNTFQNIGEVFICETLLPYMAGGPGGVPISQPGPFQVILPNAFGCDQVTVGFLTITSPGLIIVDTTVCEGELVIIGDIFNGGSTFTETGFYSGNFTDPGGCQSTFQLDLTVYDPVTNIDTTICNGESLTVGGNEYSAGTTDLEITLPSQTPGIDCDSTVILNLTILDPIETFLEEEICEGDTAMVGSEIFTTTGEYTVLLQASNGCDSTVFLDLFVNPNVETTITPEVCFGDDFVLGDSTFTATGTYEVPLMTTEGCDSTVIVELTVKPEITTTLDESICEGDAFMVGGMSFDTTGTYDVVLTAADGCDSTVTLNLDVIPTVFTTLDEEVCNGGSFTVGTSTYDVTGTYMDTLPAINTGCDSVITLNLTVLDPIIEDITRKVCTGQSVMVGSSTYDSPGMYTDTLMTPEGCDSIVNLTLTIEDVIRDTLSTSICEGEVFTVAGTDYDATGLYPNDFVTASGCDSVFYLNLTVVPTRITVIDSTICDGESVTILGNDYTTTGMFEDVTTAVETGCDSIVRLNLTVLNVPRTDLTESICDGETYTVGTSDYTTTGMYADTLQAANGCDSIITLDLTVLDVPEIGLTESICDGETYTVGTSDYTASGFYTDTLVAANGCDSIVMLDLTVLNVPEVDLVESICQFESYEVGPSSYTMSGSYVDTLVAANGCDSIVSLELTVFPVKRDTLDITICNASSYTVGSNTYNVEGTYVDTLSSNLTGCDSIVTLNLTVRDFFEINLNRTVCEGESFTVGTTPYDSTGMYSQTFISVEGCDSIVNLNLTVIPFPRTDLAPVICEGDTFNVAGNPYFQTGVYMDTLTSFVSGCDSIITLDLTVNPTLFTSLTEEICDYETYTVGTSVYNTTGIYTDTLSSVVTGCDSIVTLDLTVHPTLFTDLTEEICDGETYTVGTSDYTTSGNYVDTLSSVVTGCDSIITLDLTVYPIPMTSLTEIVCFGDTYTVGTSTYDATGNFVDTLTSAVTGCDSIVMLDLTVREEIRTELVQEICDYETFSVGNSTYNTTGMYADTLTSIATGCDSIVTLDLTVHPTLFTELTEEICDYETFTVGSSTYNTTGVHVDTLSSVVTGCDSIVTLDLTVHPTLFTELTEEICDGETYTVGTSDYTTSGNYVDTLSSVVTGCDSIITLDLTVHPIPMTNLTEIVCFGDTYTVGTSTYDATGNYVDTLSSVITGCDSIVTLDLTVREEIRTELVQEICDYETFSVGNSNYNTTGMYADTLTSVATGCDSIVTLDLTVYPTLFTELTEEICDYETFTVGSSTYNTTGVHVDTLSSVETGCDSIVTLNLTVHPTLFTSLTQEICDGESFGVGTSTYTTSGTFVDTLSSMVTGCDSIITLDLTVYPIEMTMLTEEICESETFSVGSSTYSEAGSYTDTLTSVVTGCDSIVMLDLVVNPEYEITLQENICDGESFPVGAESFSQTGTYTVPLTTAAGCDSIVTLELSVFPCELQFANEATDVSCFNDSDGEVAFEVLVGTPPYTFTWQALPGGLPNGNGTIDGNNLEEVIDQLPAGTYRIDVVDSSPFEISGSFQVVVAQPEPVDIELLLSEYNQFNVSCASETDGFINGIVTGGIPPYSYTWSNGSRLDGIDELGAGTYSLTVTDANGCTASAEATLIEPEGLNVALSVTDPLCFGDEAGVVSVDAVEGGVTPYVYGIDGSPMSGSPLFTNLTIGSHLVQVQDANGCTDLQEVIVNQPEELIVDLGDDIDIELGESVELYAETTNDDMIAQYIWRIDTAARPSCLDCVDPLITPQVTMSYFVTVIDENNCQATDQITVFVDKDRDVFIPNVFSPNGDGSNDVFTIFAGPEVIRVNSFQVYNRWGEPMYEIYDFPANDPTFGWDGTHRGELMNGGVYVYVAEIEFVDGVIELYKGDVLLMR